MKLADQASLNGQSKRAFTLVEVTIALGIMSFSMMVILGLIPVGLTVMRQAMDSTIETQIVQKISGETLLTPYSNLATLAQSTRYFDEEGEEQSGALPTTRYVVTFAKLDPVYPTSSSAPTPADNVSNSLTTIQVKIQYGPNPTSTPSHNPVDTFNLSVANSGN